MPRDGRYGLYGLSVASWLELPGLPIPGGAGEPDLVLERLCAPPQPDPPGWRFQQDQDEPPVYLARSGRDYLLRLPDGTTFQVAPDAIRIGCWPAPDLPQGSLIHALLDHAVPRALSLKGWTVLHASAVTDGERAVAFLGPSGRGKSTLAAGLCRRGWTILCDDALVLRPTPQGPQAWPSYPGSRLWPDSAAVLGAGPLEPISPRTDKGRAGAAEGLDYATTPVPLARLVLLEEPGEAVSLSPLRAAAAVPGVLEQSFRLEDQDRAALRDEFLRLTELVEGRCLALRYPRRADVFGEVDAALRAALGKS